MASFLEGDELERAQEPSLATAAGWIVERAEAKISELQQTHELQSKLQEQQLESLRHEYASLEAKLSARSAERGEGTSDDASSGPAGAVAELATQLSAKNEEISKLKHELDKVNAQFGLQSELLSSAKAEAARHKSEVASLSEEVESLSERMKIALEREEQLHRQLNDKSAAVTPLTIEVERLKQELSLKEANVEWYSKESETQHETVKAMREKFSSELLETQQQLDEALGQVQGLENQLATQKARNETLQKENLKLEKQQSEVSQQHHDDLLALRSECDTLKRLNAVLKQQTTDKDKYVAKLEGMLAEAQANLDEQESDFKNQLSSVESQMKQALMNAKSSQEKETKALQNKLKETQDKLSAAQQQLESISRDPLKAFTNSSQSSNAMMLGKLSESAANEELEKSGLSSTALYQRLVSEIEGRKQEHEKVEKLEQLLNRVYRDIESKAPAIEQQRVDHQELLERYDELNDKLVYAMRENSEIRAQISELTKTRDSLASEIAERNQEASDLARQVQALLKAQMKLSTTPDRRMSSVTKTPPRTPVTNANQVISENLVAFESVEELHQRNMKLLKVVRELSREKEQDEEAGSLALESEMTKKWKAAMSDLDEMRRARVRQQEMVESIVRQRDMYRVLLAQADAKHALAATSSVDNGTTPQMLMDVAATSVVGTERSNGSLSSEKLAKLLDETRADFADFRRSASESDKKMQSTLEEYRKQLVEASNEKSRVSAELKFQEKRYAELLESVNTLRDEAAHARDSLTATKVQLSEQQKLIATKDDEVTHLSQQIRRVQQDKENAMSEKRLADAEVNQLRTRCSELQAQRDSKEQLVASFKSIEETRTLEHKVSVQGLIADKEQLRNDLKQANEDARKAKAELVQQELSFTNKLKEATASKNLLEHEMQKLKTKCSKLEGQLEASQSREALLKEQLSKANRVAAQIRELRLAAGKQGELVSAISDAEALLNEASTSVNAGETSVPKSSLEEAEAQIAKLEQQLAARAKDVEAYRAISKASEDALQKLSKASEEWKVEHKAKYDALQAEHEKLKSGSSTQMEKLKETAERFEKIAKEKSDLVAGLEKERDEAIAKLQKDTSQFEKAVADAASFKKIAEEAKQNYDRELQLHAADSAALVALQKESARRDHELRELKHKLETATLSLSSQEESWNGQRLRLESQVARLTSEGDDHRRQNSLLMEQVSSLTQKVKILQQEQLGAGSNLVPRDDNDSNARQDIVRLQEILEITKRQLETAVLEKEETKHNLARLQQQLEQAQRSLVAARDELSKGKKQGDVVSVNSVDYKKMLAAVEENSVLRNLNAFMSGEQAKFKEQNENHANTIAKLKEKCESLNKELSEVDAYKAATADEIAVLKDNVTLYQERYENLMKRFGEKVDPNEHQKLVEQLAKVESDLKEEAKKSDAASEEHKTQIESMKNMEVRLRKAGTNMKQRAQDLQKKLDKLTVELEELKTKDKKAEELANTSTNAEITQLKETNAKQKESLLRFQRRVTELKTQLLTLQKSAKDAAAEAASDKTKAKKGKAKVKSKSKTTTTKKPEGSDNVSKKVQSDAKSEVATTGTNKRPLDPTVTPFVPGSSSKPTMDPPSTSATVDDAQANHPPAAKRTRIVPEAAKPATPVPSSVTASSSTTSDLTQATKSTANNDVTMAAASSSTPVVAPEPAAATKPASLSLVPATGVKKGSEAKPEPSSSAKPVKASEAKSEPSSSTKQVDVGGTGVKPDTAGKSESVVVVGKTKTDAGAATANKQDVSAAEKARKLAEVRARAKAMRDKIAAAVAAAKSSPERGAKSTLAAKVAKSADVAGPSSTTAKPESGDSAPPTDQAAAVSSSNKTGSESSTSKVQVDNATKSAFGSTATFGKQESKPTGFPTFGQLSKTSNSGEQSESKQPAFGSPSAGFGKPTTSFGGFGAGSSGTTFGSGFGSNSSTTSNPPVAPSFGSPASFGVRSTPFGGSAKSTFGSSSSFGTSTFGSPAAAAATTDSATTDPAGNSSAKNVVKFSSAPTSISDQIAKRKARFAAGSSATGDAEEVPNLGESSSSGKGGSESKNLSNTTKQSSDSGKPDGEPHNVTEQDATPDDEVVALEEDTRSQNADDDEPEE